ncbi:MAG: hypothetical protein HY038_03660 [Nitrospirae bacterium]|nr:hypothetical protein [Nitrospirota bacterium]
MTHPIFDLIKGDVYAGIAGIDLDCESLDLGNGVLLSKTSAHVLAPYMVVFDTDQSSSRANLDGLNDSFASGPDGTRWINVTDKTQCISTQREYPITAEIYFPAGVLSALAEDRISIIRWIIALLRIWSAPQVSTPIIANVSFGAALKTKERLLLPFETEPRGIRLEMPSGQSHNSDRLSWVRECWEPGLELARKHKELHLAVQAIDQAHFVHDWALGVLLIWAALEGLFSPSRSELQFRISALISSYLEPPGHQRRTFHKQLIKLYEERSAAAHGRSSIDRKILLESMELLRRIIVKMISESKVPSKDDLEARLFGG